MASVWVSGTGTDIGKTVASLALCSWAAHQKASKLHYLKPVQCGTYPLGNGERGGDANWVDSRMPTELIARSGSETGKTAWNWDVGMEFPQPASPHYAARLSELSKPSEGTETESYVTKVQSKIVQAQEKGFDTNTRVVIEGAGGMAVPFDDQGTTLLDLLPTEMEGILVCAPTLGTLNHSLLSIEYAKSKGLSIAGFLTVEATPPASDEGDTGTEYESPAFLEGLRLDNIQTLEKLGGIPHFGHLPYVSTLASPSAANLLDNVQQLWEGWTPAFTEWWNKQ
jgi:dethiobiotin synthase